MLSLFLWITLSASASYALDVQNLRFGVHPDKTRLVIELSENVDYRVFMLPAEKGKGYRLAIDMPNFAWKAGTIKEQPKIGLLDVRSGSLTSDIMRIVVDLKNPAAIDQTFFIKQRAGKSDRLVIDFRRVSQSAYKKTDRRIFGLLAVGEIEVQNDFNQLIAQQDRTVKPRSQNKTALTPPKVSSPTPKISSKAQPKLKIAPSKPPIVKTTSPLYKPLIVIDAGHGGADPGAIGANNKKEKTITLAAAKELKNKLESTGKYRVALTRSDDRYLKLYRRVSIARDKEADLFISLHADSIDKSNVRGASIYTLSDKASDAQTAKLAQRENQADLIAGVDLSHEDKEVANILLDLAMRDTMNQSKFFANVVVEEMVKNDLTILPRPHRYAGFAVLKAPDIPSVLVEMGFMSNKEEARLLSTQNYRRKVANSLVDSIDAYFSKVHKNGL